MNNTELSMKDVMEYMAWIMFNGFDNQEMNRAEDLIPINSDQITAKRGVCLLVQSCERR